MKVQDRGVWLNEHIHGSRLFLFNQISLSFETVYLNNTTVLQHHYSTYALFGLTKICVSGKYLKIIK